MDDVLSRDIASILDSTDLSPLEGSTVLLAGATGLVGTYLLATLVEMQSRGGGPALVTGTSRTGVPPAEIDLGPRASIVTADLSHTPTLDALPEFDFVIHAAGYGQPGKFTANPLATIALNTSGTLELASHVAKGGRMLFDSTSEIYSGLPHPPFSETQVGTTNTDHPRASYIEGKRAGEAVMTACNHGGDIHGSSARLALAYGPGTRADDSRVLNEFIRNALKSGAIRLRDSGTAMRTYCYATDAIEMLFTILLRGSEEIYNVGGTSRTSVADLARSIGEIVGVDVEIPESAESQAGAPDDVWLDLHKTLELSGKSEFVPLSVGLERTVAWQRDLYR